MVYHQCKKGTVGEVALDLSRTIKWTSGIELTNNGLKGGVGRIETSQTGVKYLTCLECGEVIGPMDVKVICRHCGKLVSPSESRYLLSQAIVVCNPCKKLSLYSNFRSVLVSDIVTNPIS